MNGLNRRTILRSLGLLLLGGLVPLGMLAHGVIAGRQADRCASEGAALLDRDPSAAQTKLLTALSLEPRMGSAYLDLAILAARDHHVEERLAAVQAGVQRLEAQAPSPERDGALAAGYTATGLLEATRLAASHLSVKDRQGAIARSQAAYRRSLALIADPGVRRLQAALPL